MESLNEKKTVEIFDQLVSEGIIIYGPHEKIIENCGGYPVRDLHANVTIPTTNYAFLTARIPRLSLAIQETLYRRLTLRSSLQ